MTGYTTAEKFRYWLFQDKIPLTKLLILSNVITFVGLQLFHLDWINLNLGFIPLPGWMWLKPWTIVTYPLIGTCCPLWGPIGLLFALYWLWIAGGSLERSWGLVRYVLYFLSVTALSAVGILLGGLIIGVPVPLGGLLLPLACITISFAMLNPEQEIIVLIVPMKLKYLAILDVALTFISYGRVSLVLGIFSLTGCAYAYWYVKHPVRYSAPRRRAQVVRVYDRRRRNLNPFAGIKDWNDRRKLKKLFDRSYGEDDEHNNR